MKSKIVFLSIVILALTTLSNSALAEAPCTHVGQENLQIMARCIRGARAAGTLLDSHNNQILNTMAASPMAMPHPYPYTYPYAYPYGYTGYPSHSIYYIVAGGGYRKPHGGWPLTWYAVFPY